MDMDAMDVTQPGHCTTKNLVRMDGPLDRLIGKTVVCTAASKEEIAVFFGDGGSMVITPKKDGETTILSAHMSSKEHPGWLDPVALKGRNDD